MNNTDKLTRTYDMDKIDDLLCELDNSKIRINALMDFNLKLKRINNDYLSQMILNQSAKDVDEIVNTSTQESK